MVGCSISFNTAITLYVHPQLACTQSVDYVHAMLLIFMSIRVVQVITVQRLLVTFLHEFNQSKGCTISPVLARVGIRTENTLLTIYIFPGFSAIPDDGNIVLSMLLSLLYFMMTDLVLDEPSISSVINSLYN